MSSKPFAASLIHGGIIGGTLCISETEAVFRTIKFTVSPNKLSRAGFAAA